MLNKNPVGGQAAGAHVDGWILLQTIRVLQALSGNNYLNWEGLDINAVKVWGTYFGPENVPLPTFLPGAVIAVKGPVGEGKRGLAIWAKSMTLVMDQNDAAEFEKYCYPCVPVEHLTNYIANLKMHANSIKDPSLLRLSLKLFEYLEPYLWTIPAGKAVHEPYRGGLAQHTWEVVNMCSKVLEFKGGMNRDVLLFSALYHDIGKTQEYTPQLTWSENGRLISHSSIGIQLVTFMIMTHDIAVDPNLLRQVKHCLLSHHGEHSEIHPATKEAIVLYYSDNMMARVGHIEEMVRSGGIGSDGWGKYSNIINQSPYVPELDDRIP